MENQVTMSGKRGVANFLRITLTLLLLFNISFSSLYAQSSDPSTENLHKNGSAITQEMQKIREKQRHDEIMSYVYMSLGFAVVIAIAWGTTLMARNRSKKQLEEKQRFILKQQELKKNGHGHGHTHGHGHALHKAKR